MEWTYQDALEGLCDVDQVGQERPPTPVEEPPPPPVEEPPPEPMTSEQIDLWLRQKMARDPDRFMQEHPEFMRRYIAQVTVASRDEHITREGLLAYLDRRAKDLSSAANQELALMYLFAAQKEGTEQEQTLAGLVLDCIFPAPPGSPYNPPLRKHP
jgi:hypothetical protein